MSRYKAVLFDAFNTIWHQSLSLTAIWCGTVADLGNDPPTE